VDVANVNADDFPASPQQPQSSSRAWPSGTAGKKAACDSAVRRDMKSTALDDMPWRVFFWPSTHTWVQWGIHGCFTKRAA
jgi:hypothetical protein